MGYFLLDEDFGEELSVYVDFFVMEKVILLGLNKMVCVVNVVVILMFVIY